LTLNYKHVGEMCNVVAS